MEEGKAAKVTNILNNHNVLETQEDAYFFFFFFFFQQKDS